VAFVFEGRKIYPVEFRPCGVLLRSVPPPLDTMRIARLIQHARGLGSSLAFGGDQKIALRAQNGQ
jgi:hypothetical protein